MSTLFIFLWFGTGFIGGCMYYHYIQTQFPLLAEKDRRSDSIKSMLFMLLGPLELIATLTVCKSYGLALPFTDPLDK